MPQSHYIYHNKISLPKTTHLDLTWVLEANVIAYENKGTLATLMLSCTIFAFGSTIASTVTAGVGALVMSAETAASPGLIENSRSESQMNNEKSLRVKFQAHSIIR